MTKSTELRLIYIAPRCGVSGVGDYAEDFLREITPYVGDVRELRHAGPGRESVRDILRVRRQLRAMLAESPSRPTIVHSEQSGGALTPFWAPTGIRGVAITATVHDAPLSVWSPFRTRAIARSRVLTHGVHRPMFGVMNRIERRVNRSRTLFTLTALGGELVAKRMPESTVVATEPVIPLRRRLRDVADRPLAVGLFGYVYRGKGFEALQQLRSALDDDIAIRVAGRGTENLPEIAGVEVLGEVNGEDEDRFFDSIRALMVPYAGRQQYGIEVVIASSTVSRALAYQTPVIALRSGAMVDDTPGVVVVAGGADELGRRANALLRDDAQLGALRVAACGTRNERTPDHFVHTFIETWEALA